jgi:hypothetical protein
MAAIPNKFFGVWMSSIANAYAGYNDKDDLIYTGAGTATQPVSAIPATKDTFSWSISGAGLILKAIKVPLVGVVDVTIRKARGYFMVWADLLYTSLPHATSVGDLRRRNVFPEESVDLLPHRPLGPHGFYAYPVPLHKTKEVLNSNVSAICPCDECGNTSITGEGYQLSVTRQFSTCSQEIAVLPFNDHVNPLKFPWYKMTRGAKTYSLEERSCLSQDPFFLACKHQDVPDMGPEPKDYPMAFPQHGPDGLGLIPRVIRHKGFYRYGGLRCHICHPRSIHGWSSKLVKTMDGITRLNANESQLMLILGVILHFNRFIVDNAIDKVGQFMLTALTYDRLAMFTYGVGDIPLVALVDSATTACAVKAEHPKVWTFVVPLIHGKRSIASWRVLLAFGNTSKAAVIVVNGRMTRREFEDVVILTRANHWHHQVISTGNMLPTYAGSMKIMPGHLGLDLDDLAKFFFLAPIYGWDEVFPVRSLPMVLTLGREHPAGFVAGGIDPVLTMPEALLSIMLVTGAGGQASMVYHSFGLPKMDEPELPQQLFDMTMKHRYQLWFSRFSRKGLIRQLFWLVARMHSHAVGDTSLSFFHVLTDPRRIEEKKPEVKELYFKFGEPIDTGNIISSRVIQGGGVDVAVDLARSFGGVYFHTFGTRGDRVPVRALARHVSALVGPVHLIHHCSDQEGLDMLADAERGESFKWGWLWNRATMSMLLPHPAFSITPFTCGPIDSLRYSFVPPRSIVNTFRAGAGIVGTLVYAVLGLFDTPDFSIGAYTMPGWVPRSADGESFLAPMRQPEVPTTEYYSYGSSSIKFVPPGGAIELPAGDHQTLLSECKVLYCAGQAGIVQTAAASGARVVVMADPVLDRAYKDVYDAGKGVDCTGDPDNIYLAFAKRDSRWLALWLKKNWEKPWKLLKFYGIGPLGLGIFRVLMGYILASRVHSASIVTTDPMQTLLMVLSPPRWRRSIKQLFIMYICAKIVDRFLDQYQISYWSLASYLIRTMRDLLANPIATIAAQVYGLGPGLAITALWKPFTAAITFLGRALAATFFNSVPMDDRVYLEYVLVWQAVPVLHVALVHPLTKERYEGVSMGVTEEMPAYGFRVRPGGFCSPFIFPTSLDWSEIKKLPPVTARYGPIWNCQTGLYAMLTHHRFRLGLGGVGLLISSAIASTTLAVGMGISFALLLVGAAIPSAIGLVDLREHSYTLTAFDNVLWDLVARLRTPDSHWLSTVVLWYRTLQMPFMDIHDESYAEGEHPIRRFFDLPILKKGDPQALKELESLMKEIGADGTTRSIALLVRSHLHLFQLPSSREYDQYHQALTKLCDDISHDPECQLLMDKWDDKLYLQILTKYGSIAYPRLIDQIIQKSDLLDQAIFYPTIQLTDLKGGAYYEDWVLIRRFLADNTSNPATVKEVNHMIDKAFIGADSLREVVRAAVGSLST